MAHPIKFKSTLTRTSMPEININQYYRINFEKSSIDVDTTSLKPRLRISINVTCLSSPAMSNPIDIELNTSEIKVNKQGTFYYAGMLTPDYSIIKLFPSSAQTITYSIDLDHYLLSQIEKLRDGKDMSYSLALKFVANVEQPQRNKTSHTCLVDVRIAKSDWVEKLLSQMKFKEVFLFEFPKLEDVDFSETVLHIDSAWKQYLIGEYSTVLIDCRRALESFKKVAESKALTNGDDVDFEKIVGNKNIGNIMADIYRKLWGFVSKGAHIGTSINKEEADFALISIHALMNYCLRKTKMLEY